MGGEATVAPIPAHHPLRKLFRTLAERNFHRRLGYADPRVIHYLADLLADFTHIDNVYKIRTAAGKRVEEVAEMLLEADLFSRADSLNREREVHKHIGDFTLFMTGIFPEYVRRLKASKVVLNRDALVDYIKTGKRSYWIVSEHTYGAYSETAPLFRRLSEDFELCVFGLGYVRNDLERLKEPECVKFLHGQAQNDDAHVAGYF